MALDRRSMLALSLCLAVAVAGCSGNGGGSPPGGDTTESGGDDGGVLNVGVESDGSDRYVYVEPDRPIPAE